MNLRELRHTAVQSLAGGRYARAEVMLRQLMLQSPHDGQLWVRHAEALRRLDRHADAAVSFQRGAKALAEEGHISRGIAALKLALALRPDDLDLISELIQLQRQRSAEGRVRAPTPPMLDKVGPLDAQTRTATLEFAMSDLGRPSAPRLALPARPASLDLEGNIELEVAAPTPTELAAPPAPAPFVRRISERSVAVQAAPGAPWVVLESTAPITVRQVD
jgi:hypothetical protein